MLIKYLILNELVEVTGNEPVSNLLLIMTLFTRLGWEIHLPIGAAWMRAKSHHIVLLNN